MKTRRYAFLAIFALLTLITGRISLPPFDRDESRYLQASRQMVQSGDLIDIRFQDQPRWLQPAGIYWLQAGTVRLVDALAGTTEPSNQAWTYRIVSLLAGVANVLLTASIGASLFGAEAGFLAGLLLATSVLFNAEGRLATIDTTLLTAILVALRALLSGRAALYWGALGCSLMLKGPVGLLPGLLTPLALALTERSLTPITRLRPAWGIPLMLAVPLPWLLAIEHVSHGRFLAVAVGHNLLGKIGGVQEAHGAPPGTYAALFLATFWPGSLFAVLAVPSAWGRRRDPAVRFVLCWILPTWIVFELIATKLPHYVLPTYPAIACLTAAGLITPVTWPGGLARGLAWLYGGVWLAAGLTLAASGPVLLAVFQHRVDPVGLGTSVVGAGLIVSSAVLVRRRRPPGVLVAAGGAFLIYAGLFTTAIPQLTTFWLSPRVAEMVARTRPCPDSVLASASFSEPSLVFLTGRGTRLLDPANAARFIADNPACNLVLVGSRDEARFRAVLSVAVRKLAEIDGVNYSNGRRLALALYAGNVRR